MGDQGPTSGSASDKLCQLGSPPTHISSDGDGLELSVGLQLRGVPDLFKSYGSSPQKDAITCIFTRCFRRPTEAPRLRSVDLTLKMDAMVLVTTDTSPGQFGKLTFPLFIHNNPPASIPLC